METNNIHMANLSHLTQHAWLNYEGQRDLPKETHRENMQTQHKKAPVNQEVWIRRSPAVRWQC